MSTRFFRCNTGKWRTSREIPVLTMGYTKLFRKDNDVHIIYDKLSQITGYAFLSTRQSADDKMDQKSISRPSLRHIRKEIY